MQPYEFSEENKECLLHFLQVARNTKNNKYCNLLEHRTLSKFIPLNVKLSEDLDHMNKACDNIIDITESDEEVDNNFDNSQVSVIENLDLTLNSINHSTVDDILYSIKESLQVEKYISTSILNNLNETKYDRQIFELLSEELNCEDVLYFGDSLKNTNICNDLVISFYIRYVLLKKLNLEYSDQLQELLNDLSLKFLEIMLEELTQTVLRNENYSKVFLQFVDGLNINFKQKLFWKFITSCEKLDESHIPVIELLTANKVEIETLSKFFEIVSSGENCFSTDKSFGKLLMNILKLLGKNVPLLEQPLKHIIGSHTSIWKSKLQKKFEDCLQESSMLSQSIRY